MKKNSISNQDVVKSLFFVECKIEQYLKRFYNDKNFKLVIYGDIGVPAFTLTVFSYFDNDINEEKMELIELVDWFKNNALFNGLRIGEEVVERDHDRGEFEFKKYYTKIIRT
ncbi:hypothetical protein G8C92_20705 [Paenibacillus donghaensis]|uniref:hypothetical protein n=1 Tax=Paenibacillus donghaensis TaxID=414771 RepID=UPI0018832682|nr:hypothetical protein [Paenibacillus donghaensis]MBE9916442.1 hypothetical protein [Paenibacillus donghaensis]